VAEYVAFARIDGGGRVRLLGAGSPVDTAAWGVIEDAAAIEAPDPSRSLGEVARERWQVAREQWAITTFFLFDPNSWR
jgi:hypothetical protein